MKTSNILILVGSIFLSQSCMSQKGDNKNESSSMELKSDVSIRQSILNDVNNLNPLEYAYALPELCQLMKENKISLETWKLYIDSLNVRADKIKYDTVTSNYALDTKGLIQKQILFLVNTLKNSQDITNQYPKETDNILKNTSIDIREDLGMPIEDILRISDVVGETNFWFLLQIEGCSLIGEIMNKKIISKESLKIISSNLGIISTSRAPYALQKRKLKDLQSRLWNSENILCKEVSELMNKRIITIEDRNELFFRDHPNWNLTRTF